MLYFALSIFTSSANALIKFSIVYVWFKVEKKNVCTEKRKMWQNFKAWILVA